MPTPKPKITNPKQVREQAPKVHHLQLTPKLTKKLDLIVEAAQDAVASNASFKIGTNEITLDSKYVIGLRCLITKHTIVQTLLTKAIDELVTDSYLANKSKEMSISYETSTRMQMLEQMK